MRDAPRLCSPSTWWQSCFCSWEWAGAEWGQASWLLSLRLLAALQALPSSLRWVFPRAPAFDMPAPVLAMVTGQVLPAFLLCSTLLIIKMYVVAVITGQVRLRKKVRAALGAPGARALLPLARCPGGFRARGERVRWETPCLSPSFPVAPLWLSLAAGPEPPCPPSESINSLTRCAST